MHYEEDGMLKSLHGVVSFSSVDGLMGVSGGRSGLTCFLCGRRCTGLAGWKSHDPHSHLRASFGGVQILSNVVRFIQVVRLVFCPVQAMAQLNRRPD